MKMIKKNFTELIKLAKYDSNYMMQVLEKMTPLVKSYAKKIFFIERSDAEQELYLAIIESIKMMPKCETDGQCLTYINNAVKFKFAALCKKNIKREQVEDLYKKDLDEEAYFDKYEEVEILCDLQRKANFMGKKEQEILKYLIEGYSDSEIGKKMGMSRQYINRIKKNFGN